MNIEFDEDTEEEIDFYCKVLGLTREEFITNAVKQYIQHEHELENM